MIHIHIHEASSGEEKPPTLGEAIQAQIRETTIDIIRLEKFLSAPDLDHVMTAPPEIVNLLARALRSAPEGANLAESVAAHKAILEDLVTTAAVLLDRSPASVLNAPSPIQ